MYIRRKFIDNLATFLYKDHIFARLMDLTGRRGWPVAPILLKKNEK